MLYGLRLISLPVFRVIAVFVIAEKIAGELQMLPLTLADLVGMGGVVSGLVQVHKGSTDQLEGNSDIALGSVSKTVAD